MFENYFSQSVQAMATHEDSKQKLTISQELGQRYFDFNSEKLLIDIATALNEPLIKVPGDDSTLKLYMREEDVVVVDSETIKFTIRLHPAIIQLIGLIFKPDIEFSCVKDDYNFSMKPIKSNQLDFCDPNIRSNSGVDAFVGLPRERPSYPAFTSGFAQFGGLWCFKVVKLKNHKIDQVLQA